MASTDLTARLDALRSEVQETLDNPKAKLSPKQKAALKDRVSRSLGLLRTARAMPTESALAHLSNLRLGVHLGIKAALADHDFNRVTGHQANQKEGDQRDADEGRDDAQQLAENQAYHRGLSSKGSSRLP